MLVKEYNNLSWHFENQVIAKQKHWKKFTLPIQARLYLALVLVALVLGVTTNLLIYGCAAQRLVAVAVSKQANVEFIQDQDPILCGVMNKEDKANFD